MPVPEQDLGSDKLFVPLRTEEIGWEEGGLIWAAKRYCYPTVNLYGGVDDRIIGTYRGGPKGYRFVNITDPAFRVMGESCDATEEPAAQSRSKTSASGSKSAMPRGPVTTVEPQEESKDASSSTAAEPSLDSQHAPLERRASSMSSVSSSSSSSRQGSFSNDDDGSSSGAETGATTPTQADSPVEASDMAGQLDAALSKVHYLQDAEDSDAAVESASRSRSGTVTKLAKRTGGPKIPSDPVDASRLSGPFRPQQADVLLDKTMRLSDSVPARHFQTFGGRAQAEPALPADVPRLVSPMRQDEYEYAAGWAYEQNMCAQLADLDKAALPLQR